MRFIAFAAAALALMTAAGCAAVYGLQNEFVYPNAAEGPMDRPTPPGAIEHWLETPDGARVESWLFLPSGADAGHPAPAVIFFHGNSDFIENKLEYAEFYTAHGIACLLVEYRGYRRSTGEPSEAALESDAAGFFDWLSAQPQIDAKRIAVHGHSLGAAIAAHLATVRPVKAVIMVSAFRNLPSLFARYRVPGALAHDRFDNEAAVAAYAGPLLLVHGEADEIVPLSHERRLAQIAGAKAHVLSYAGVDHDVPWDWRVFGADLMAFLAEAGMLTP